MGLRRKAGYSILVDPDAGTTEWDRTTCGHCNAVIRVPGGKTLADVAGWCWFEQRAICLPCKAAAVKAKGCVPFLKKIERQEARERFRVAAGLN